MASLSMLKILVMTTYLVLVVQAQQETAPQTASLFDEAECLSCVGTWADYIDNGINDSSNNNNAMSNNNNETPGAYCRLDNGNYGCYRLDSGDSSGSVSSSWCPNPDNIVYTTAVSCTTDIDEVVDTIAGIAQTIFIAIIVGSCCCCFIVVGAIAACVYCCVQGSNQPLPAGVPGAYQTNPALHQQATNAMTTPTTMTIPAQTGLATAVQPAYQPQYYKPTTTTMEDQTNVPFAQALSVNPDGTTKQY